MAATQLENIRDLVVTTINELGEGRWTDLSYDLQEYVALPQLLRKKKIQFSSGLQWEFQVITNDSGAAENVELYQELSVGIPDVMAKGTVPIRHTNTKWAYDEREVGANAGKRQVNSIVKVRRHASMTSLVKKMEVNVWTKPATSADEKTPWGIPMSVVKETSDTTVGLNGGNPAGFTGGYAGLSSATYPQYANWAAAYSVVSKPDAVAKMRECTVKSGFKAPIAHPSYQVGPPSRMIHVPYTVYSKFVELAEQQNDNLGKDIASMDGVVGFQRIPIMYTPYLDADTDEPIYGIDWSHLYPIFLSGFWMKEHPPIQWDKNPNVFYCHVDLSWNIVNADRRRHWVLAKAA